MIHVAANALVIEIVNTRAGDHCLNASGAMACYPIRKNSALHYPFFDSTQPQRSPPVEFSQTPPRQAQTSPRLD